MGVRRLAGRYSAVRSPKTPIANEKTAIHAGALGSLSSMLPVSEESESKNASLMKNALKIALAAQARRHNQDDLWL